MHETGILFHEIELFRSNTSWLWSYNMTLDAFNAPCQLLLLITIQLGLATIKLCSSDLTMVFSNLKQFWSLHEQAHRIQIVYTLWTYYCTIWEIHFSSTSFMISIFLSFSRPLMFLFSMLAFPCCLVGCMFMPHFWGPSTTCFIQAKLTEFGAYKKCRVT